MPIVKNTRVMHDQAPSHSQYIGAKRVGLDLLLKRGYFALGPPWPAATAAGNVSCSKHEFHFSESWPAENFLAARNFQNADCRKSATAFSSSLQAAAP